MEQLNCGMELRLNISQQLDALDLSAHWEYHGNNISSSPEKSGSLANFVQRSPLIYRQNSVMCGKLFVALNDLSHALKHPCGGRDIRAYARGAVRIAHFSGHRGLALVTCSDTRPWPS